MGSHIWRLSLQPLPDDEDYLTLSEDRLCRGCGRRKTNCPCWAAGAGDEAAEQRRPFNRDQLALIDYVKTVMEHGRHPVAALVGALRIEFAGENYGLWQRAKIAWRVLRGT